MTSSAPKDVPDLASKECVPCKGGVPPIKGPELEGLPGAVNLAHPPCTNRGEVS
jgi:hypothetical protein